MPMLASRSPSLFKQAVISLQS